MSKNNTKGYVRAAIYVLMAVIVIATLVVGGIYAKYVAEHQTTGQVSSPDFYFTSDVLTETASTYTLNAGAGGTTSLSFELRNYADALRFSDKAIAFSVEVAPSDGVTVTVNGVAADNGTLASNPSAGSSASVTVSGLKNGVTYRITATGNAGFVRTLSADIEVRADEKGIYKHLDTSDPAYLLLTVWTKNLQGDVSIAFPDGLIPDNSDAVMNDVYNYVGGAYVSDEFEDTVSFTETYSSHVYRFFRTDDGAYTADDFTVKLGDTSATTQIPQ